MAEVVWTEPALQDLDAIADYIALDKPEAARALVRKVLEKVERLGRFPGMGSIPPELPGLPYRQLVFPPCRVFYRPEPGRVLIVYVCREERQIRLEEFG